MKDPESTDELRAQQRRRQEAEEELAQQAADEVDESQHRRRAEKAGYLEEKLAERARSEQEADSDDEQGPAGDGPGARGEQP